MLEDGAADHDAAAELEAHEEMGALLEYAAALELQTEEEAGALLDHAGADELQMASLEDDGAAQLEDGAYELELHTAWLDDGPAELEDFQLPYLRVH